MGRPTKGAARMRAHRIKETNAVNKERLTKCRKRSAMSRSQESKLARHARLSQMRNYRRSQLSQESPNDRICRLNRIQERLSDESSEQRDHRLGVMRERLSNETPDQREHRLGVMRERLSNETPDQREHRLGVMRERLSNETPDQREHRLGVMRERLSNETPDQREHRLGVMRERLSNETPDQRDHRLGVMRERLSNETPDERDHRLGVMRERLSNETPDQRDHRLGVMRERLSNETPDQREHRLDVIHQRRRTEPADQRIRRLTAMRERNCESMRIENEEHRRNRLERQRDVCRRNRFIGEDSFQSAINVFADVACSICKKLLYPMQRCNLETACSQDLLPNELIEMHKIVTCSRCLTNLRKRKVPAQAYWNKMDVAPVPPELACLSEVEQRLLSRMIPFLKIIKVQNRFSQSWCKGQVVLFAQDVVEVAEQLPLPISSAGLVIVVESRENLEQQRQFNVNTERVKTALEWLLRHNRLYHDVIPNFESVLEYDISQIIHVADIQECTNNQVQVDDSEQILVQQVNQSSAFRDINSDVAILHGTFYQGNHRFDVDSRGKQCTAVAAVACTAFASSDANRWTVSDIDYIVIIGDSFYRQCIESRENPDAGELNVEYLAAREILPRLQYNGQWINLDVQSNSSIDGHIDRDQSEEGFPNLENGLISFFRNHHCGILTSNSVSIAIACHQISGNIHYWLFDSHARGPKGNKASTRGKACCMRFVNTRQLFAILRRNLRVNTGNENFLNTYSITPVSITIEEANNLQYVDSQTAHPELLNTGPLNVEKVVTQESLVYTCSYKGKANTSILSSNRHTDTSLPRSPPNFNSSMSHDSTTPVNFIQGTNNLERRVILSTSLLYSIDEDVPNLENVVNMNNENQLNDQVRVVDIQRKTAPPINIERERRMEELCWYFLFPDGKNGFGEIRDIAITALDYFQARIMGKDNRFKRNDYLFFALSVVEYFKAKASVSVSCRMKQGEHTPQGLVDNMHLTMRNIRGSAAYWKRCCAELIAMVRSLGPPTWFVTFSCNDLNWPDMIKALLIADGRPDAMPDVVEDLPFDERLELVQKYPVVVARQFTVRVNALMRFLKLNPDCLGGAINDYWYRIEFQNRGSPHLHMLLWCNSIPEFQTTEGLRVIDQVVSCSLGGNNSEQVKRLQTHKHSTTCYKDRNAGCCRFGFPRAISATTKCLEPDDALRNNGRFCEIQRNAEEVMINNYNTTLLKIWEANMDVQPCGTVTAVAYYIAKYASKCEPNDCGDVVREAVQKAKRQSNDVWKQLFAVSMAILGQRLVSAPEAAYRLCHLPLKMCSRKTVFVNSCRPEQRYRLLRFNEDETSVFNNILDRYQLRPDDLEGISLAEFAVRYETVSSTFWNDDDGDIELRDHESESARYIQLRDNSRMRIRNQAAVLRTRYYTLNSDREGFYYSLIVCHIPFRCESELILEDETAEACFLRRQSELRPLLPNLSVEQFAHAEQVIQQALVQAVALDTVNQNDNPTEHNVNIYAEDQINVYSHDDFVDENNDPTAMPDEVFVSGIRSLNVQQKDLLKQVSDAIERDIRAQLETTSISSPQAKSPAGSSAGAAASASTAPGERTPTAHNKQLQNVKGQDHPPHPSMAFLQNRSISLVDMYIDNSEPSENVGQIHFSLEYDFQNTTLILRIIQGKELPAKDLSGTSDPYVRVTLLPDKKHRLETKIKRRTLNPRWNETFYFEGFPIQKLQSRVLHLHVFDYDRFSRDDSIGEVFLPLCQVDLSEKPSFWKALKPPAKDKCGELLTSLCYHPSNSVLTLTLLKARNLKAKDINGKSDPYVKVWLQFGDKRIEKRKTAIFKCTLNPVFNDSFSFNVPWEKIRECSLDVQVMDFDNIGRNELIGRILLAGKNGSGATETKHWQDMITKPRQTIVQWHRLKPE